MLSLVKFWLDSKYGEVAHSQYHRIVQSAEHRTRLSENRGCEDGSSIPPPCGKTLTLIYHIMKDSFKKILSLVDELAKNADVANEGGIIVLATNPNSEKGDANGITFVKGRGIDLIATLSVSFKANDALKEFAKDALFMSAIIPDGLVGKKE